MRRFPRLGSMRHRKLWPILSDFLNAGTLRVLKCETFIPECFGCRSNSLIIEAAEREVQLGFEFS